MRRRRTGGWVDARAIRKAIEEELHGTPTCDAAAWSSSICSDFLALVRDAVEMEAEKRRGRVSTQKAADDQQEVGNVGGIRTFRRSDLPTFRCVQLKCVGSGGVKSSGCSSRHAAVTGSAPPRELRIISVPDIGLTCSIAILSMVCSPNDTNSWLSNPTLLVPLL